MSNYPIYFMAIWNLGLLLAALAQSGKVTIKWPSFATASQHNRLAGWSLASSFAICFTLGVRFSWAETFDTLSFLDVFAKISSFAGFVVATYFVLAPSAFRTFLSELVPNVVGWLLIAGPIGLGLGGSIGVLFGKPHAAEVAHIGFSALFCAAPILTLIELTGKRATVEERLRWFAATLVLAGSGLQVYISIARFTS